MDKQVALSAVGVGISTGTVIDVTLGLICMAVVCFIGFVWSKRHLRKTEQVDVMWREVKANKLDAKWNARDSRKQ